MGTRSVAPTASSNSDHSSARILHTLCGMAQVLRLSEFPGTAFGDVLLILEKHWGVARSTIVSADSVGQLRVDAYRGFTIDQQQALLFTAGKLLARAMDAGKPASFLRAGNEWVHSEPGCMLPDAPNVQATIIGVPFSIDPGTSMALIAEMPQRKPQTEELTFSCFSLITWIIVQTFRLAAFKHRGDSVAAGNTSLRTAVDDFEKALVLDALMSTRGNRTRAATLLRTTERIVTYKARKYQIDCRQFKASASRRSREFDKDLFQKGKDS